MGALSRLMSRTPHSRDMSTFTAARLNSMIDAYVNDNNISQARKLFDENPSSRSLISWHKMIAAYVKNHQIQHANDLFDQMPHRNPISWSIMLSGFHKSQDTNGLFQCFLRMGRTDLAPDAYILSTLIAAVSDTEFNVLVHQVHAIALHLGLNLNDFVGSSLITAYASLGDKEALVRVFDDISTKKLACWNALVSGYIRIKQIDKAQSLFDKMNERNEVSWTTMITGYVQNNMFMDALKLFLLMLKLGTRLDHFTFTSVIGACADSSSLLMGLQVHSCVIKSGITEYSSVLNSLVDMYAKCGDVDAAFHVFESTSYKTLWSWNSIIGGYACHGLATRALEVFDRMEKAGVTPDEVTFINLLSACAHAGLVEEGEKHFVAMSDKYGIQAEMKHCTCMVDLYGKAGKFDEAEKLIKNMQFEPDAVLWGTLLAACSLHSNLELGEYAAERIQKLGRNDPVCDLVLLKIQGEKGSWSSVNESRDMMKERKVERKKAISWVE